ncbi:DUF1801 domain-containing protein [Colwellia hornerae]|uniref:DUF1801 domain-containing protein n=1 Tax=Colwellia hornerae TaxID=89402 RepID=A0A5C6QAS3_9GAMM|nr:DUF1801 domain-containing protein [Colwellia hornerae]TWX52996.1 DUF1801 domain-containing protein [Colwellia hornerae]TWX59259.1 DUF1801 domain-containing protein [Colwellia hornerae]TWX66145.1 DUF1801 domain-containing protein [Colwellia hornerae]
MNQVMGFILGLDNKNRKSDSITLLNLLEKSSGYTPYLNGSLIGFGQYHYRYDSGRKGHSSVIAFSPRKQNLVVYIMPGFSQCSALLEKLGKYTLGKSCLYINKLADINIDVLEEIIRLSVTTMQHKYPCKNI